MLAFRRTTADFGQCLRKILADKDISASELARMMSVKSRNSVFRILSGESGYSTLKAFCDRLMDEDPLALTHQEREALVRALNVSRVGAENYYSYCEIAKMIGEAEDESLADAQDLGAHAAIADIEEAVSQCREAHITITGCCDRQLFEQFRKMVLSAGKSTKLTITHFIYTGEREVIHNISAVQPLLFESCYVPYALEPDMFLPEREQLYRSNCVLLNAVDREGKRFEQVFLLVDKGVFCTMGRRAPGGFQLLKSILGDDTLRMHPLKKNFASVSGVQTYADFISECAELERGRTIYNIRQDVPLSYVHPDILVSAVTEGFGDTGFAEASELEALLPVFYKGQMRRYQNLFEKRRMTHTIFTREAMERFARTGEMSDHFFAMRPFMAEERVQILSHLRDQAVNNPHFKVYFFCDGYVPPRKEIGLYEGAGILFAKPNTDYNLAGDHAEAIVDQPQLCERYRGFYLQYLLEDCVVSREETLKILDSLIDIAKEAQH